MKNFVLILLIFSILGCKTDSQKKTSETSSTVDYSNCARKADFGDLALCLPKILGMNECYSIPNVKQLADHFEVAQNQVIGFYVNDKTFAQVENLAAISYDDYCKIYGTLMVKNTDVGSKELHEIAEMMRANFVKDNWEEIRDDVIKNQDKIVINQPAFIEAYKFHDQVESFLMMGKFKAGDFEYVLSFVTNALLVNDRLIWLAYYKYYEGPESLEATKLKNNLIVQSLMDSNLKN